MSQQCPRCNRLLDFPGQSLAFCCFCGAPLASTPAADPEAPTVGGAGVWPSAAPDEVGEYRLVRRIGAGGMGTVFEGEHKLTGRRVAIKLIDAEASPDALERFRQEGRLASSIAHPHCVFVLAADEDAGRPFIVMELMPGRTLDDLVRERGPLSPRRAVRLALDVIDGLEQAHGLGVIHRDVKPSNCFLDEQERVKVGDFGLARSLRSDVKLTRTGSFIGTPLFAAPEQIRAEPLDARADVYSVCATLYFLLTGKAPFDTGEGDVLGVMARIVTEEAPLVRSRRPEVPVGLERVLQRGLARDRDHRFRDLAELRHALVVYQVPLPGFLILGRRFVAYAIDFILFYLGWLLLGWALANLLPVPAVVAQELFNGLFLAWFGMWEGLAGFTPGKRLLDLRIHRVDEPVVPGLVRGMGRALLLVALFGVPVIVEFWLFPYDPMDKEAMARRGNVNLAVWAVGLLVLLSPMRKRNGYRLLTDALTGTRVALALPPLLRPTFPNCSADLVGKATLLEATIGPYRLLEVPNREEAEQILAAVDPTLDRPVWLWLRPTAALDLPGARRETTRPTRLRWLACGQYHRWKWDAFLAPRGASVAEIARQRGPLEWREVRSILEQIADELQEAKRDGTLPAALSLGQVWVQPDGQVQLLDVPVGPGASLSPLDLLGETALLLLEGKPRAAGDDTRLEVLLPLHARQLLEAMPRLGGDLRSPGAFRRRLTRTQDLPARLSRAQRTLHLSLLVAVMFFCNSSCVLLGAFSGLYEVMNLKAYLRAAEEMPQGDKEEQARARQKYEARLQSLSKTMRESLEITSRNRDPEMAAMREITMIAIVILSCYPLLAMLAALVFRGGVRCALFKIAVVQPDGRPASRFRCVWRALLCWGLLFALFLAGRIVEDRYWDSWTPDSPTWPLIVLPVCWGLAGLFALVFVVTALIWPSGGLHDRLAGTRLVPQ
jgi:hypothetical protein